MEATLINVRLPSVSLKIVVVLHFILTIWGDQIGWLPVSYLLCNLAVLALGVWAIASAENSDATQLFLFGMIFTILHDIIVIAIYYNSDIPGAFCSFRVLFDCFCWCNDHNGDSKFNFEDHRNRGGEFVHKWSGNPYVTIEGSSAPHPTGGYPAEPTHSAPPQM